ncbi:hypothetical protein M758_10G114800 [Ceratodon purpureus]|nr:hypothetical protein M758_10G114800 [Ceratodon purpureus]
MKLKRKLYRLLTIHSTNFLRPPCTPSDHATFLFFKIHSFVSPSTAASTLDLRLLHFVSVTSNRIAQVHELLNVLPLLPTSVFQHETLPPNSSYKAKLSTTSA